jgi:hypothetical protein
MHHHLDRPVREFNMDADLHPGFKEGECKRSSPSLLEVPRLHDDRALYA